MPKPMLSADVTCETWVKEVPLLIERHRPELPAASQISPSCPGAALKYAEPTEGKTAEEALSLKTNDLAGELGPLPPMKIHCAELVQGALRSALEPEVETKPASSRTPSALQTPGLLDGFNKPKEGGVKIVFLGDKDARRESSGGTAKE